MACKCSGYKVSPCQCKLVGGNTSWNGVTNGVVLVARTNSFCSLRSSTRHPDHNTLIGIIDILYEKCATYNLRYCPNRGYRKSEHNVNRILKDLLVLVCFILANTVVLCNILTKTVVHFYYVIMETVNWAWRYLEPKLFLRERTLNPTSLTHYNHDFTPQSKRKKINY